MSCRTPHGLTPMSETQTAKGTSFPPPLTPAGSLSGSVRRCQVCVQVPRGSGWSGRWGVGELVKANDPF